MKRILKWLGMILGGLIAVVVLALLTVYAVSGRRINRSHNVTINPIPIPNDAETIAWGQHLVLSRGCTDCHGEDLAGRLILDEPPVATIYGPNLTPGRGGISPDYSDQDYLRALRHGLGQDGRALWIMPSHEYYFLSDEDAAALIAYLKTLPPVDNEPGPNRAGPLARVLFLAGELPLLPAELIDHDAPRPTPPARGVTAAYGAYLAVGCAGCHGQDFSGGPVPGAPPGTVAANLTPGSALATWTEADFIVLLRTGVAPDGREVDWNWMPIGSTQYMTDEEIMAIWLYLQSLPAR